MSAQELQSKYKVFSLTKGINQNDNSTEYTGEQEKD